METSRKIGLIILYIAIIIASIWGFIIGFVAMAWSGEYGFIALIVGSGLVFIGAVFGIVRISKGKRITAPKRKKRPTKNIIIWTVVAIVSAVGSVLQYIFGMRLIGIFWLSMIINVLLGALFLVSIFVLIFGGKQKPKDETEEIHIEDVESAVEEDIEDQ